ncbi:hypothetical protein C8Q80DRAFT_497634 [Daedaleopsis nitida]|nr:hypothetical protein C8Q80DRAFT_497634 [Daedaleopsis nitida]
MSNMQLLDMNDDVLRHICDYLFGRNALDLSLASRRLHDFAYHRVAVTFTACKPSTFRSFCKSVLHGTPPRAQYLETFRLKRTAFTKPGAIHWSGDESDDGDDPDGPSRKAIRLLVDLLRSTPNLRELSLNAVYSMMRRNDDLGPALSALRLLTHVELNTVSKTTLKFLGETGWDLRMLTLDFFFDFQGCDADDMREDTASLPLLLETLAKFPRLRKLKVVGSDSFEFQEVQSSAPVLPSIRHLIIQAWHPTPSLTLIDRCPNVDCLDLYIFEPDDLPPPAASSWSSLRSLLSPLTSLQRVALVEPTLLDISPVFHLCLTEMIRLVEPENSESEEERPFSSFLPLLKKTSPVWLQARFELGAAPMTVFWAQVPVIAPRLRCLELELGLAALSEDCRDWVDNIPDALAPLPLVYLRLVLSKLPYRKQVYDDELGNYVCDAGGEIAYDATEACAQALSDARARALTTLPERCARAIPTLQFVVVADEAKSDVGWPWVDEGDPQEVEEAEVEDDEYNDYFKRVFSAGWQPQYCFRLRGSGIGASCARVVRAVPRS